MEVEEEFFGSAANTVFECVDIGAIEDADERAATAEEAVWDQSYGADLACAVAGDATGESPSVELDGTMTVTNGDWLTITGSFHAVVPCGEDDKASAEVRLNLDKNGVKIDAAVGMVLFCAAADAGVKKFKVGRCKLTPGFFSRPSQRLLSALETKTL